MRRVILLLTVIAVTLVLASGVALAVVREGGPGSDILIGTKGPDDLLGQGGDDTLVGLAGSDFLEGDEFRQRKPGNDVLYGGPGRDDLVGMGRDDVLYGGDGDDNGFVGLWGGEGEDVLFGGDGNDFLDASHDGQRDWLSCGAGKDQYAAEKRDIVSRNCEQKTLVVIVD